MKTTAFTSFTPVNITGVTFDPEIMKSGQKHMIQDPQGGEWRSVGLSHPETDGDLFETLEKAGTLCAVEIRERILPGKVIQEATEKAIAELTKKYGHKPSKSECSQIREDVEHELLPKSHIRKTVVYVIFGVTQSFIFTTSPKKLDIVSSFLTEFFWDMDQTDAKISPTFPEQDLVGFMTSLALAVFEEGPHSEFVVSQGLVLKNETNVVRVKDENTQRDEYISLIKIGYRVDEIGVTLYDNSGEARLFFKMNSKFTFKGVSFSDTFLLTADIAADDSFHAFAWMVATAYTATLKELLTLMADDQL